MFVNICIYVSEKMSVYIYIYSVARLVFEGLREGRIWDRLQSLQPIHLPSLYVCDSANRRVTLPNEQDCRYLPNYESTCCL